MNTLSPQIAGFYFGCKVECTFPEEKVIATMTSLSEECMCFDGKVPDWYFDAEEDENQGNGFSVKFLLRPLSSMSEEEAREIAKLCIDYSEGDLIRSRKMGSTYEVVMFDPESFIEQGEEINSVSDDEIFEECEQNEALTRIELNPKFNIWKGWEHDYNEVYDIKTSYRTFTYLLSKSFDLFGLIEAGLAIDKTKTI